MLCLASRGRNVLAAVGGLGIVGVLVVVLIVIAIIYFVRRADTEMIRRNEAERVRERA